jgi:MFS family permease
MSQGIVATDARRRFGWYYGWNNVALGVLAQMTVVGLAVNCFSLFLLDWSRDFHAPISHFALAMTVFAVCASPATVLSGWLSGRFPIRWVYALGMLANAGAQLAIGFSASAWMVVAIYAFIGVLVPISTSVPAQTMVARWFVKRRGLALGISAFGVASAKVFLPAIVGLMLHSFGWRETWWLYAAVLALVIAPILLLAVREHPGPTDDPNYLVGAEAAGAPTLTYRQILARPNFWLLGLGFLCVFSAYMGVVTNLPPLVKSHGLSTGDAVILLSAFGAADLVAKLLCGAAADRFGNQGPMVTLCALGVVAGLGLAFAPNHGLLIAGLIAMGLVGGVWAPLASATAVEFGRQNFSRAFGLVNAFAPLTTITPWVVARTQEQTGSYTLGLMIMAGLALVGLTLSLFLREKKPALTH